MNRMRTLALVSLVFAGLLASFGTQAANQVRPDNVLEALKANKDLSKFTDFVKSSGLESELAKKDARWTIFAPSNAAMDKLPSDVLKRAKAAKDGTASLAKYHMINGSVVYATNIKGRRAGPSTANGEMLGFDGTGKDMKVGEAIITMPDQITMNGVVHTINTVLVPESLKDPKIKEEAQKKEEEAMRKQMEEREAEMKKEAAKMQPAAAPVAAPTEPAAKSETVAPKAETAKETATATETKTEEGTAPTATMEPAAEPVPVPATTKKEEKKGFLKNLFGK